MLAEVGLGDANGFLEIIIGELRVDDGVAVGLQVGRFDAAWDDCLP